MKKFLLSLSSLVLIYSVESQAVNLNTKQFEYKCAMPCGELSIAGIGNCRGVQIAGVATKDASGAWTLEQTDFVYSPHTFEFFKAIACPAQAKAQVAILGEGAFYISADAGTYSPPAQCPDGSSITKEFSGETRKFSLFLKYKGWDTTLRRPRYSSLATVVADTSWGSLDFSPECEITNEKN